MRCITHSQGRTRSPWPILVWIVVLTLLLSGCGATATKVYRVGILSGLDFFATTADGFKDKMTKLGYVEGKNVVYDLQKTNFDPAKEQAALNQFVTDKVDLIISFPTEASIEAKAAALGTNIPVVFANAALDGNTLVNSVREPGGNITGVQFPTSDNAVKRFEILHELVPNAKRMWVAYLRDYPTMPNAFKVLRPAAEAVGVTLVEVPVTSLEEIQADLQARSASDDIGVDAILIVPEPLTAAPPVFEVISKFAEQHKLPIGGALLMTKDYGSLFGYTPDSVKVGEQTALLADKIFTGTPAGTIPVVTADSYLWLNYKMAQQLGLTVPDGLLRQAAQVIR
jgi:putative tryptophan/tyrosine transport system substrate-binding protein